MKYPIFILMLLASIILIIVPAKSQSIIPIQADTVFKGYGSGETSSVKFINHGTALIYNHNGVLHEMNAKTYKEIRTIHLDDPNPVTNFEVDENCKYIFYNTKSANLTYVADYYTGQTIKTINGRCCLTKDKLFIIPKGDLWKTSFYVFNSIDFTPLDSFYVKTEANSAVQTSVKIVQTIYNKNTFLFSIFSKGQGSSHWSSRSEWHKVDPVTNQIGGAMLEVGQSQGYLFNSNSGKYSALYYPLIEVVGEERINKYIDDKILILDSAFKTIYTISENNLKSYYNDASVTLLGDINFLNDRYLISSIKYNNGNKIVQNLRVFDIQEKKSIKFIDFENYTSACYNDKFILSNRAGCFVTLTLEQLPVIENNKLTNEYSVSYSNNNLLISSDATKQLNIRILNITGEEVESINNIYVTEGSNTIPLNKQLATGLYFCIINTPESTFSRKFMVIK